MARCNIIAILISTASRGLVIQLAKTEVRSSCLWKAKFVNVYTIPWSLCVSKHGDPGMHHTLVNIFHLVCVSLRCSC